jgi:glutathione S-transferase
VKLVIGNKNYSSWSLRPWLLLTAHQVPFEEVRIALDTPQTAAALAQHTESGKVPALHDGDLTVWESLAICEYVSERCLQGRGWPVDPAARARARAASAEMHAGFAALRQALPMNCRATGRRVAPFPALEHDIARVRALWAGLRRRHGAHGPWLAGPFSIADCMYAPVAFRFRTYGIELSGAAAEYMERLLAHQAMQRWLAAATRESEVIETEEVGQSRGGKHESR